MKTKLLFLFLCSWFVKGFAQNYKPFPDSNAYWIEQHGWLSSGGSCGFEYHNCTDPVYFGNDTTINSLVYHKLYYRQVCSVELTTVPPPMGCQWMSYYNVPENIFTFLRQDTLLRKVFIYDQWSNQDTLLYDFNLSVGDTLPQTYNNPSYPNVIVTSIDSLLLQDGYHKRYFLNVSVWVDSACIIEGIGSSMGLTSPLVSPFENGDKLLCFSHYNVTIYPDSNYNCDLTVGILSENKEVSWNIFPNPTHDFIHIKNNQQKDLSIAIFSSMGEVVKRTSLIKDAAATINLSALAAGIYLVTAKSDKSFAVQKLVKQ